MSVKLRVILGWLLGRHRGGWGAGIGSGRVCTPGGGWAAVNRPVARGVVGMGPGPAEMRRRSVEVEGEGEYGWACGAGGGWGS